MKSRIYCLVVSMTLFMNPTLSAWWDAGHMAVAEIAYEDLLPEVKEKVDAYLESVSKSFPNYSDFVTASLWADDIVHDGINAFHEWHGKAIPYDPQNILSPEEHQRILAKFEGQNIVWAISECLETLENPKATTWAKGFMLRMLIHIVADIHQPCHCVSYYSPEFPNGDRAGTKYKIKHPDFKSLHAIFDGAFGLCVRQPERPMNDADKAYLNELVALLKNKYPRESLSQLDEKIVDKWRQESYDIGVNFAYAHIRPNKTPSENVMKEGKEITGQRIALAGYRLADLLNKSLSN